MSQLSLLTQLKLQRKLQKSQSQLLISDSLDELGTEEELEDWTVFKPESRLEQIDNLVLMSYLFHAKSGTTSDQCYSKVRFLCSLMLSANYGLTDYPVSPNVSKYPNAIVCTCGKILKLGGNTWGLVRHCDSCKNPNSSRFWIEMFPSGVERSCMKVSKLWAEWAQVQAIQLETQRKSNQNRVTDFGEMK